MALSDKGRIGLVLSGGGGKGSYQIGVWRALEEFGVAGNVSAVAGTSVGALNAVLFKQGDVELAARIWRNLKPADVLHRAPDSVLRVLMAATSVVGRLGLPSSPAFVGALATRGVFSRDGLKKLSAQCIDWERVAAPGCAVSATALRIPLGGVRHFPLLGQVPGRCLSILLASSAIPVVFPPEEIDGERFIDGGIPGIGCNTPVEALTGQGCKLIIVVLLARDDTFDVERFPNHQVLPIFPQEDQGGLFGGTLDFDGTQAERRMRQGYDDTVRILEPIYRMGRAQLDFERALDMVQRQQCEWQALNAAYEARQEELHQVEADAKAAIELLRKMPQ
ncbi:MAG: patatin-like phospholipase family protein [Candidatus Hydrogenedentota bacterium]